MHALILCAGLGERMRPLTWVEPKPLLQIAGRSLVVSHLERLAGAGVRHVVITTAWLAHRFPETLGAEAFGMRITYSFEGAWPLETGGGIRAALPLLGDQPFLCINGDIWSDFDPAALLRDDLPDAHLLLRPMPGFRQAGVFESLASPLLGPDAELHTFAGYARYRPEALTGLPHRGSILPWWLDRLHSGRVAASAWIGEWEDIGTVERLQSRNGIAADVPDCTRPGD